MFAEINCDLTSDSNFLLYTSLYFPNSFNEHIFNL